MRRDVRFAALGDSVSDDIGDPTSTGSRGWARILVNAIGNNHHMPFCTLARPGAPVSDVRNDHHSEALDHPPHLASLIVGLSDALHARWDPPRLYAHPP